jgi:hypothetical protein
MYNEKSIVWTKPPAGWCKLNFDAGYLDSSNTGSWGAILRNENGVTLLSAWRLINHCLIRLKRIYNFLCSMLLY